MWTVTFWTGTRSKDGLPDPAAPVAASRYQYKEQYEQFKLIVNLVAGILGIMSYFINNLVGSVRVYYSSVPHPTPGPGQGVHVRHCLVLLHPHHQVLVLLPPSLHSCPRESILIVNGSRIKGWWRFHHFISVVAGGILLVWPGGEPYRAYREQHIFFNVYITLVQVLKHVTLH